MAATMRTTDRRATKVHSTAWIAASLTARKANSSKNPMMAPVNITSIVALRETKDNAC